MPLHPDAARFLALPQVAQAPPIWEQSLSEARAAVIPVTGVSDPVAAVVDEVADGPEGEIRLRRYEPIDRPIGTLMYFYGGGWVTGDLDTHDALCRRLAIESAARIIAVDYRRAPEHPFPAAVDDACAATQWAADRFDQQPLGVCGDSAGGNLAAAVALSLREAEPTRLDLQVLIYPITDSEMQTESYRENAEGYFLTREAMEWFWDQYAPLPDQRRHPYASPLRAESLAGLPAALVVTAEFDVLRDEGRSYVDRLRRDGTPVEHIECAGMIHAFVRRLSDFATAGEICHRIGRFVQSRWAIR